MNLSRRLVLVWPVLAMAPAFSGEVKLSWQQALVMAGERQIGKTVRYDSAYVRLAYPNGDVPPDRGVCSDVIIRAYRQAFGLDLQKLVHEDMVSNFSAYPQQWRLKRPDSNIDHRRVLNLMTYFKRRKASLPVRTNPSYFRAGDLVTQLLPGNLPHIVLVSAEYSKQRPDTPLVIQNIGQGARQDDTLFSYPVTGHFRFQPGVHA